MSKLRLNNNDKKKQIMEMILYKMKRIKFRKFKKILNSQRENQFPKGLNRNLINNYKIWVLVKTLVKKLYL